MHDRAWWDIKFLFENAFLSQARNFIFYMKTHSRIVLGAD